MATTGVLWICALCRNGYHTIGGMIDWFSSDIHTGQRNWEG